MFGKCKQFSRVFIVAGVLFFSSNVFSVYAALKDSDVDGLTDQAEINAYHTDPNNNDTDGDGFDDGYEVANNTNPLEAKSIPVGIRNENIDAGLLSQLETAYIELGLPGWVIWIIVVVGSFTLGFFSMLIAAFLNTFIVRASASASSVNNQSI